MTSSEAEALARAYLLRLSDGCDRHAPRLVLLAEQTQVHDFGWVFFWNSAAFLASGLDGDALAGNCPLIVERKTGSLLETGTAYELEHYIERYRQYGHPHAEGGTLVLLAGCDYGAGKVAGTKLVRDYTGVGLADAKRVIEQCLAGEYVTVEAKTCGQASALCAELRAVNFNAEQLPQAPC